MNSSPLPLAKRRIVDGVVDDDDVGFLRTTIKDYIIHASPEKKRKLSTLLDAINDSSMHYNIPRENALGVLGRCIKKNVNDIAIANQLCHIVVPADDNVGATAAVVNNQNDTTVVNAKSPFLINKTSDTTNAKCLMVSADSEEEEKVGGAKETKTIDDYDTMVLKPAAKSGGEEEDVGGGRFVSLSTPHASKMVTHTPRRVTPTMLTSYALTNQTPSTRSDRGNGVSSIDSIRQRLPTLCSDNGGDSSSPSSISIHKRLYQEGESNGTAMFQVMGISDTPTVYDGNHPFRVLGIGENSTTREIKHARCVLASRSYQAFCNGDKNDISHINAINAVYKMAMQLCQHPDKYTCPGFECIGNEDMAIGDLLPCFNTPVRKGNGFCKRCFHRSIEKSHHSTETQLGRLLIFIGHPFICGSAMRYGSFTTTGYCVPAVGLTTLRHIIDHHYFYKDKKIVVEQDEEEHNKARKTYSVEDELKGLVGREQFAGLSGLIIRNNCRDDQFQDPLQVRLIDAIITEYKTAVDTNKPFVQKSIIVYIDYRDGEEYPEHVSS